MGLWLSYNDLSGQLPVEIAELDKLRGLGLDDNRIIGTIPAVIGDLTDLQDLSLSGNNLSGAIPPELSNLVNLNVLSLNSNKLTGDIPEWVKDLRTLEHLYLNDNQLTGDISSFSENLGHLTTFSIAGNNLSGCLHETLRDIEETDFLFSRLNYCDEPPKQQLVAPAFIKWEVGDAVRASEERAASLGVKWLFEYAESIGWPIAGETINVHFMTLEPLAYALAIEDGTIDEGEIEDQREFLSGVRGFASGDANFNRATEEGESITKSILYSVASLLIHENLHTAFQVDLDGLHTSPSLVQLHGGDIPRWITEGMATYFDSLIPSLHGGESDDFLCRDCEIGVVPVNEIELSTAENVGCAYICGAFAIELLASIVGQRHIVDFYTIRRPGRAWQQTFEDVFGISVPDFYALYDQHRAAGFPELNPPITPTTVGESDTESAQLPDDPGDRAALVAFYNATRGDSWNDNTNWLSNQPLASWYGVSVDSSGRVQGLSLSENRLHGTLPAEVGDFTRLKWLYLNGNQIRGTIPERITELTYLEDLWLGQNQLAGSIPETINRLTNLQYLALDDNNMSGPLHASMMSMGQLRYLNLEKNNLTGPIPNNLGDLKSLEVLILSENQLTGSLPDSIGALSNLRDITIWDNQLSGTIPASLGNLSNLRRLVFINIGLSGRLPATLGNLTTLEYLDLRDNRLSGHLPVTLGKLTNMGYLFLSENRFNGMIPEEFANMTNLRYLLLDDNQLVGQIPAWLTELKGLRAVYLAANSFTGCIPPELFNISIHDLDDIPLPKCS